MSEQSERVALDRLVSSSSEQKHEKWMCWKGFHVQTKEQMARHKRMKLYPKEVTDAIKVCRECGCKIFFPC